MTALYDVAAIGNAIVDVIAPASEDFLERERLIKGSMILIDQAHAVSLYGAMAPGVEISGGSAGNSIAGLSSFGGKGAFIGKVAADALGEIYAHDMRALGARFDTPPLNSGAATGRCLINVTADGERTMATFLGAAGEIDDADVDGAMIEASRTVYLEGYLFDPPGARRAFAKAAAHAHGAGRQIALTLSDAFVVDRHRETLLGFIETQVDILFANEGEICSLFQTTDFAVAAEALRGKVAIAALTRGAKGSVVLAAAGDHTVAAEPAARIVDTTGAGDQYAAGFLWGLARERPLGVCARLGGLAAAEVIAHYGPRPEVSLRDLAAASGL